MQVALTTLGMDVFDLWLTGLYDPVPRGVRLMDATSGATVAEVNNTHTYGAPGSAERADTVNQ